VRAACSNPKQPTRAASTVPIREIRGLHDFLSNLGSDFGQYTVERPEMNLGLVSHNPTNAVYKNAQ